MVQISMAHVFIYIMGSVVFLCIMNSLELSLVSSGESMINLSSILLKQPPEKTDKKALDPFCVLRTNQPLLPAQSSPSFCSNAPGFM